MRSGLDRRPDLLEIVPADRPGFDCAEDLERMEADPGLCGMVRRMSRRILGVRSKCLARASVAIRLRTAISAGLARLAARRMRKRGAFLPRARRLCLARDVAGELGKFPPVFAMRPAWPAPHLPLDDGVASGSRSGRLTEASTVCTRRTMSSLLNDVLRGTGALHSEMRTATCRPGKATPG